ncbi:metallophosphoesterase family protein [Aquibacillus saliphilus]|uniref:metallophosphoesterase family protein n=1 Tax=Aquibacillus saliphilus TaxID=1909422 RepID=UPI001CF07F72|nr:DNA repair exonuclease [Aquibacillus saliphilus]
MMNEKISFIHCADLHLDSPFSGLSHVSSKMFNDIRQSTFTALHSLVSLAIENKVDFVLIVGDLFDSEEQSLKALIRLKHAFEQLNKYDIEVYISFGNHDFLDGGNIDVDYPKNVHIFNEETVTYFTFNKKGKAVANIYGFSYKQRGVLANKSLEFNPTDENVYHIGMLHGSLASNTEHDVYAPFQLSDLINKEFDYWALGHIHKRQILKENPPVVYPGNTQGRSKKESGEKGCYYVELDNNQNRLEFKPLQQLRFENLEIDSSCCKQPQELEALIEEVATKTSTELGSSIITIHISSDSDHIEEWHQAGYIDEILDYINESNQEVEQWVFIRSYSIEKRVNVNKQELKQGQHFLGELLREFEGNLNIEEYLQPLLQHRQARKFLSPFSEEEQEQIRQEAEDLLMYQLLKE